MPSQPQLLRRAKKRTKAARPRRGHAAKTEREKRAFTLFLQQTTDFRLALVLYNDVVVRGEMIRETRSRMEALGRHVLVLDLREPSEERSLLGRVGEAVKAAPQREPFAIMVINLEGCVDYSPELSKSGSRGTVFLETANLHRELFPTACPAPLVFWMTELMERAFIRHAPDLWHWRSHVFDLRTRKAMRSIKIDHNDPRAISSDDDRLHPDQRLHRLEEELAAYRTLGDRFQEMRTLNAIGLARAHLGDVHRARQDFEEVRKIAQDLGDRQGEGMALGNLGNTYADSEPRKAIEFFEQDLSIAREVGDRGGEGMTLGNLGNAYSSLGENRKAIEFYEQDLSIAREVSYRRGEGAALGNLGTAYGALEEARKAIEFLEQSLTIAREVSDRRSEANALNNLGNAYSQLGEPRRAIEFQEQGLSIMREVGDRHAEAIALYNIAAAYAKLGDYKTAINLGEQSLAICGEIQDPREKRVLPALEKWKKEVGDIAN